MAKDLEFFKTLLNGLTNKIDSDRTWDKLKDKPFYEETKIVNEPMTITWDGNTEGLVHVGEDFFKVSDVVLTDDQIKTSTIFANTGFGLPVIDLWDSMVEAGTVTEDVVAVGEGYAIFVRRPGSVIGPFVFPEVGIYFVVINAEIYISGLTTTEPIEHTKVITKKIDPKYLPDNNGGGVKYVTIEERGTSSGPTYITDTDYSTIRRWIDSGYDVKCVLSRVIYNLGVIYPELDYISFYSAEIENIYEIRIFSDNYVVSNHRDLNAINERFIVRLNAHNSSILTHVGATIGFYEGQPFDVVKLALEKGNVAFGFFENNQVLTPIHTTTTDDLLHAYLPFLDQGELYIADLCWSRSMSQTFVNFVHKFEITTTDTVQTMINESLGVIENGTY